MVRRAFFRDGRELKRGEFLTTIDEMRNVGGYTSGSARKPLSKDQVRSAYGHLTETGRITTRKTTRGMVITVCNYNELQDAKSYAAHTTPHATDLAETTRTPQDREMNEEKKGKKHSPSSGDEASAGETLFFLTKRKRKLSGKRLETFNAFWDAFGYKAGKAEAADAWLDIPALTGSVVSRIVAAAKKEAARRTGLRAEGKTPKMAQGWLSGRRWEDEDVPSSAAAPKGAPETTSTFCPVTAEESDRLRKVMARYGN